MAGKVLSFLNGFAGQVSRAADAVIESIVSGESSAAILFGAPVALDATSGGVVNVGSSQTDVIGVACRVAKTENTYGVGDAKYNAGEVVDVIKRGSVAINVGSSLTPAKGGTVYITKATGAWATAADSTNTIDTGWRFKGTKDSNNIVEIVLTERKY